MMKFFLLGSIFAMHACYALEKPVIIIDLPGMLGNRLFAVCVASIIAERLGYKCYAKDVVAGFPYTYSFVNNKPSNKYPTQNIVCLHDINIAGIVRDTKPRNIRLEGYFQRNKYLEPYADKIRKEWLKIDPALTAQYMQNTDDIVVHIRANHPSVFLPFSYYEKALASTTYKRVFICTDEPDKNKHPFLRNFDKYNPIICSRRSLSTDMNAGVSWPQISKINLDDFCFIRSFKKIIISHSTFAWWAAYLSDATEIYAPFSSDDNLQVYGKVHEGRYHYIDTVIGKP